MLKFAVRPTVPCKAVPLEAASRAGAASATEHRLQAIEIDIDNGGSVDGDHAQIHGHGHQQEQRVNAGGGQRRDYLGIGTIAVGGCAALLRLHLSLWAVARL
jgi:hypothetical protein